MWGTVAEWLIAAFTLVIAIATAWTTLLNLQKRRPILQYTFVRIDAGLVKCALDIQNRTDRRIIVLAVTVVEPEEALIGDSAVYERREKVEVPTPARSKKLSIARELQPGEGMAHTFFIHSVPKINKVSLEVEMEDRSRKNPIIKQKLKRKIWP